MLGGQLEALSSHLEEQLQEAGDEAELDLLLASHLVLVEQGRANETWWAISRRGFVDSKNHPLYGAALGMQGFALQMDNFHIRAEECAARALAMDPADPWALLTLLEVYDKEGRNREGLRLLRELEDYWKPSIFQTCFGVRRSHFLLELGKIEGCLKSYDRVLFEGANFEGPWSHWAVADAADFLWRLGLCGHKSEAAKRASELLDSLPLITHATAFDRVHFAILVLASGLHQPTEQSKNWPEPKGQVGSALKECGLPVVQALTLFEEQPVEGAAQLLTARGKFSSMGGTSFHCDALDFAIVHGSASMPRVNLALSNERITRRRNSPQSWMLHSKILDSSGEEHAASLARLRARDLGYEQGGSF